MAHQETTAKITPGIYPFALRVHNSILTSSLRPGQRHEQCQDEDIMSTSLAGRVKHDSDVRTLCLQCPFESRNGQFPFNQMIVLMSYRLLHAKNVKKIDGLSYHRNSRHMLERAATYIRAQILSYETRNTTGTCHSNITAAVKRHISAVSKTQGRRDNREKTEPTRVVSIHRPHRS